MNLAGIIFLQTKIKVFVNNELLKNGTAPIFTGKNTYSNVLAKAITSSICFKTEVLAVPPIELFLSTLTS